MRLRDRNELAFIGDFHTIFEDQFDLKVFRQQLALFYYELGTVGDTRPISFLRAQDHDVLDFAVDSDPESVALPGHQVVIFGFRCLLHVAGDAGVDDLVHLDARLLLVHGVEVAVVAQLRAHLSDETE